ncbi:MAG: hypothetical protein ACOYXW_07815 [Actinomycetota bacterium]
MTAPQTTPTPLEQLPLAELREHRHALLAEAAATLRWRRLVQARLDLVVAGAAPPDELARPSEHLPEPPDTEALRALLVEPGDDAVGLLRRLDAAQRALSGYGADVQTAASAATHELVERYAAAPGGCLDAARAAG